MPATSVKELIALAKQRPGQLNFVSSGTGSAPHLSAELFKIMAGIDFKIVQFKGGGPALIDLLGGHSDGSLNSIPQALNQIKAGKFRALGTSDEKRSIVLPDVPTIAESGLPGYEAGQWFGMLAPAGTPSLVIDRLSREIETLLNSEEIRDMFLKNGVEVGYLGTAEFNSLIAREIAKWTKVLKEANIEVK